MAAKIHPFNRQFRRGFHRHRFIANQNKRDLPPKCREKQETDCFFGLYRYLVQSQAIIDGFHDAWRFSAALPPNQSIWFIFGVCLASCLWFSGLTVLISVFRERLNERVLRGINLICGAVIIFYGLKLFWSFIRMLP